MNVALNLAYNIANSQRQGTSTRLSEEKDFGQTMSEAVDSSDNNNTAAHELHSAKDCEPGEVYTGYAIARSQGNDDKMPCNFYKPSDYNEEDPVIIARMYPWDGSDPIVREIHINDVSLSNADYYDTFAYGIYLEQKGEISNMSTLLTAHGIAGEGAGIGAESNERDVMGAIIKMVDESYDAGNYQQYMDYLNLLNSVKGK